MALIVEDGTGVASANTYADLAAVRTYAALRGVILSADDAVLEPMVHKSMDYLDTKGLGLLSLSYPLADDLLCNKVPVADALVRLAAAQGQLCMEQADGVDLAPTRTDAFIIEDTMGPMTTKFSDKHGGGPGTEPDMLTVDSLLAPLLAACGQDGLFKTVRV